MITAKYKQKFAGSIYKFPFEIVKPYLSKGKYLGRALYSVNP